MEVLIRVKDRYDEHPSDWPKAVQLFHAGDVIAIMPDGHEWSPRELTNPHWRILELTQFTQAEGEALLAPELNPDNLKPYVWKRKRYLDVTNASIPPAIADYLADDTRAEPSYRVVGSANNVIRALEVIKPDASA